MPPCSATMTRRMVGLWDRHLGAQALAFGSRLVGDLRMMSAIRQAHDRLRPAIPKLGGGRIPERPAAHGLAQLHDRHPLVMDRWCWGVGRPRDVGFDGCEAMDGLTAAQESAINSLHFLKVADYERVPRKSNLWD